MNSINKIEIKNNIVIQNFKLCHMFNTRENRYRLLKLKLIKIELIYATLNSSI